MSLSNHAAPVSALASGELPVRSGEGGVDPTHQFISFRVSAEEYGVDIMTVREIKGWSDTTMLPHSKTYMRGVLNLRGAIVPIFDLRARFGGGQTETTKTHVVVIVAVESRIIGMLVDAVSDILSVSESEIRPVPQTDTSVEHRYIKGLVTVGDRMVAVLDISSLFELDEITAVDAASKLAAVA